MVYTDRYMLGLLGGFGRIRTALPGYNARDPALDPRFLSLDTQWRNVFRWHAGGLATGASLPTGMLTRSWVGGVLSSSDYWHKRIDIAGISATTHTAIVLCRNAAGADPGGVQYWRQCAVMIEDGALRVCPLLMDMTNPSITLNQHSFAWFVFAVSPTGNDPTEDSASNSIIAGNHPTRGSGLYISRRGTLAATAGDGDFVLSTQFNCFQVAEVGTVTRAASATEGNQSIEVDLAGSYPDYPPILNFAASVGVTSGDWTMRPTAATWVSPSRIRLRLYGLSTTGAIPYRYAIIATDPTYVGGPGTVLVDRFGASPDFGFGVTKKDVPFAAAGANDWIFRADRMMFQVRDYGLITPGSAGSAYYDYPIAATVGAPFTFFRMALVDSVWIGCGAISSLALYNGPSNEWRRYFSLVSTGPSQYFFGKGSSVSFPSGIRGHAGVVNVS